MQVKQPKASFTPTTHFGKNMSKHCYTPSMTSQKKHRPLPSQPENKSSLQDEEKSFAEYLTTDYWTEHDTEACDKYEYLSVVSRKREPGCTSPRVKMRDMEKTKKITIRKSMYH